MRWARRNTGHEQTAGDRIGSPAVPMAGRPGLRTGATGQFAESGCFCPISQVVQTMANDVFSGNSW